MKHTWIIFRKEMLYTLRDRRSLLVMIIIPLLLFPMIFVVTGAIQKAATKDEYTRSLRIAYHSPGPDLGLLQALSADTALHFIPHTDTSSFRQSVRQDSFDLALALPADYAAQQQALGSPALQVWYLASKDAPYKRLEAHIERQRAALLQARLDSLHITQAAIEPLPLRPINVERAQETIGQLAGGFLPYIFIAFCYMGCMFPAIDLFTGEKERGTIETILATPVARWKLLTGKMLVVVASGMTTASLALFGLFVGLKIAGTLPAELMEVILSVLTPTFIGAFLLMLLPLVTFFGGIMIPATVYAKSYKEAQSILSPLNFLVIMPAIVGMMPGIELNAATACIPVLNVVLATKDLIAGQLNPLHFILLMLVLLIAAGISVAFSFKRFGDEKNILRT